MRGACFVVLGGLVGSCTLGAGDLPARDDAQAVAQRLTDQLDFEGGTTIDGALPGETNSDVRIEPLNATVIAQPGRTTVVALGIDSRIEDQDPVATTLMRFGDTEEYVAVARRDSGSTQIDNTFTADGDICADLCRRTYSVTVTEAFETTEGEVGRHTQRSFVLDCGDADVPDCEGGGATDDPVGDRPVAGDPSGEGGSTNAPGAVEGPTAVGDDPAFRDRIAEEMRIQAAQAWRDAHGCPDDPEQNSMVNMLALELVHDGLENFAGDNLQSLGPEAVAGTWYTVEFGMDEEDRARQQARELVEGSHVSRCGGTSIGVAVEPDPDRADGYIGGIVVAECVQCGDVCAPVDGPYCGGGAGGVGGGGVGGGSGDGYPSQGTLANPLHLGPADSIGQYDGTVGTDSSYYIIGAPESGWWVYLEGATDNLELYVYADRQFADPLCMIPSNSGTPCDLQADGMSDRYLRVDGAGTASGASFVLDIQP